MHLKLALLDAGSIKTFAKVQPVHINRTKAWMREYVKVRAIIRGLH